MTDTQRNLYNILLKYMSEDTPLGYDKIKSLADFKSFDSSFNALYNKGYIVRWSGSNDLDNSFLLVKK